MRAWERHSFPLSRKACSPRAERRPAQAPGAVHPLLSCRSAVAHREHACVGAFTPSRAVASHPCGTPAPLWARMSTTWPLSSCRACCWPPSQRRHHLRHFPPPPTARPSPCRDRPAAPGAPRHGTLWRGFVLRSQARHPSPCGRRSARVAMRGGTTPSAFEAGRGQRQRRPPPCSSPLADSIDRLAPALAAAPVSFCDDPPDTVPRVSVPHYPAPRHRRLRPVKASSA